MEIYRVYVEKAAHLAAPAQAVAADLRENLLPGLTGVRIVHRYDVAGISQEEFKVAKNTIFSEPNTDILHEELPKADGFVALEYLPGQFDQRADSAAQCLQLLTRKNALVRCATVYCLYGVGKEEEARAAQYLINPVEARAAEMGFAKSLVQTAPPPPDVPVLTDFIGFNSEGITAFHKETGFAMTVEDLSLVQDYFKNVEHRAPTETELRVIDTYWSDHCRHTTFLTELTQISVEKGEAAPFIEKALADYLAGRKEAGVKKPVTLMDIAVLPPKLIKKRGGLTDLDESEEINACSIKVPVTVGNKQEDWLVMFKNETHNHPTEIEPFGGAATCLGGAIRDPLSGRSYVYQAMRVTGSGDPRKTLAETLPHKLSQRKITLGAAAGFSSYGNQIGLATGQVSEVYHEGYRAKRLEIGAVVGAAPAANVVREEPTPGDVVILVGGATGRDGCGGATGSSKAHTDTSLADCGAEVQKGNPPTERKLQRLFANGGVARMIKRCNDFGAGGVCVAIGELARGLDIRLDAVPKKYEGLTGTELAISESQERMAVVVRPEDAATFIQEAEKENLTAVAVARITGSERLRMRWRNRTILDISRAFLDTNGAPQSARARICESGVPALLKRAENEKESMPFTAKQLEESLSGLNVCSQKGLSERFDSTIGAGSVLMPLGGKRQITPAAGMAALVPAGDGCQTASFMSWGFHPGLSEQSPFFGGMYAVLESLAKLTAAGGDFARARLTQQEYFPRLYNKESRWGLPAAALLGSLAAQTALNIPAIGGKDSMSGSFMDLDVPPTLVCFALSCGPAKNALSPEFKQAGSYIVLARYKTEKGMPDFAGFAAMLTGVQKGIAAGDVLSAAPVLEGGTAAAVAKMCLGNRIGAALSAQLDWDAYLPGCLVLEVAAESAALALGTVIGRTQATESIEIFEESISLERAEKAFTGTLEGVFATKAEGTEEFRAAQAPRKPLIVRHAPVARPRVCIPVFPGTNCETDTQRAFLRAGAQAEVRVICNRTAAEVEESIAAFAKTLQNCQMLMLPGGFSAGDEPDGSGKFIATFLRNPLVKESVMNLLTKQDGLVLGICNGFQALIKTGLLPHGEIRDTSPEDPTLTFNTIGRHISSIARIRAAGAISPWLTLVEEGKTYCVPVSHGEGRFYASEAGMEKLAANGQIAFQYEKGENPNGSSWGVEGIISPDGRVLGKMGHTERWVPGLYKNVPGDYDMQIFAGGVKYYL